jgi:hypothetical protein
MATNNKRLDTASIMAIAVVFEFAVVCVAASGEVSTVE